ncbi:hypothetical protein LTR36_004752 [Oleoguttula mirabilis]|uniref:Uncharacterized protein n=1 Tax=Oleoguttula mirabilis TaxID=1507867 RepID=A0AAV9JFG4_9PEZI|nr:hypothetical protein LTR36_004752 [Oleoguttula mirabilis]
MSTNFGNLPRRGSDASVTIGASRPSFEMQRHISPRPSYQTLSSEYSVATAFAVDRIASVDPPPVPALPVHVGYEQGSSLPVYATPAQARGMRVVTRSGKVLTANGKFEAQHPARQPARKSAMHKLPVYPSSAGSFEVITHQEAGKAHYDEAEAKLNGTWKGNEQYSPPHYMTRADLDHLSERKSEIKARYNAHNARIRKREIIPIGSIAAFHDAANEAQAQPQTKAAKPANNDGKRLHRELMRGVGPETSFNVSVDGAVLVPEPSVVPYASNSPPTQSVGLFRSLSNTAQRGFKKVTGLARKGSDAATKPKITHVPDSFAYDPRGYPNGATAVANSIPLREAQRLQSQQSAVEEAARYPNALPPKSRPLARRAPETNPPAPVHTSPRNPPARPRKVKIVGDANRQTQFGDFIDFFDDSDSDKSVPMTAPPNAIDLSTYPAGPPPPVPRASDESLRAAILTVKRKPVPARAAKVQKPLPPLPPWRSANEVAAGLGIGTAHHASDDDDFDVDPISDDDDDFAGHQYGKMPEYADRIFDDSSIIRQVDRMNGLSLQEKQDVATEARRLKKIFDKPPPGAMGVDVHDFAPTTVIDTTRHAGHTSWRLTDTSKPNVIESYYKQVPNQDHQEPDEAAKLFEHLEREKYGKSPARKVAPHRS